MPRGIQNAVTGLPAVGRSGDWASANWNRYSVLSGPGGLVAGPAGVTIGAFGWLSLQSLDPDNAAQIVNSFGTGVPDGFVSTPDSPAIITTFLADGTMLLLPGQPVPLHSSGDFWVTNSGSAYALAGYKAYANLSTGAASFAATGSPGTASGSASTIAAGTWSATGSISGNVMTVGAVTGTYGVAIGSLVTGAGVAPGTTVVYPLTATNGGAGTYIVSISEQAVPSGTSLSGTFGVLTVGGTVSGTVGVGAAVSGGSVSAGTVITAGAAQNTNFTGAGGAGTYAVNNTQTQGSAALTFSVTVETKWYCRSQGATGEVVKISETPQ